MPLSADILIDRLHLKRQIKRWRVIALIALVVTGFVLTEEFTGHSPIETDHVARLRIEGIVFEDAMRDELIQELAEDDHVKAVIVWIDTPGGEAVAGEEIYHQLRKLAQVKPVVAVMRGMATSAGYMIALGTDHIVAREGTITGSIGVLLEMVEGTELAKKLGLNPITIKSSPLKGTPSMVEKMTPEAAKAVQDVIDDFYAMFVGMVAERRALSPEAALKISDGRVYSGRQALTLKLIDELGSENDALAWLQTEKKISKKLEIQDAEPEAESGSFWESVTEGTLAKFLPLHAHSLDGLVAIWHPALIQN